MKNQAFGSKSNQALPKSITYTIEECGSCGLKTKREFKLGDYVFKEMGECSKCKGKTTISMIYAEKSKDTK